MKCKPLRHPPANRILLLYIPYHLITSSANWGLITTCSRLGRRTMKILHKSKRAAPPVCSISNLLQPTVSSLGLWAASSSRRYHHKVTKHLKRPSAWHSKQDKYLEMAPLRPEHLDQGTQQIRFNSREYYSRLSNWSTPSESVFSSHEEDSLWDAPIRKAAAWELDKPKNVQLLWRESLLHSTYALLAYSTTIQIATQ